MKIEKNTICYMSEKGHNNFWYPSAHKILVKEECEVERVTWTSGGNRIPIRVLKSNLTPLDLTEKTPSYLSPPTIDAYTIVWINPINV